MLGPLHFHRSQLNGAPYRPGDAVLVLVGRNRGRVARVVEVNEERDFVRVEWDDPATAAATYRHLQLLRAAPAPTSPAAPAP